MSCLVVLPLERKVKTQLAYYNQMKIKTKKLQIETRCDGRVLISLFVEKSCVLDNTLSTEKSFPRSWKTKTRKKDLKEVKTNLD